MKPARPEQLAEPDRMLRPASYVSSVPSAQDVVEMHAGGTAPLARGDVDAAA